MNNITAQSKGTSI